MPSIDDLALRELHRASILAGRAGISVLAQDGDRADAVTGSRRHTYFVLRRLELDGRVVAARRGLFALADADGLIRATLPELIDVVVGDKPYVISGGRALEQLELSDQHFYTAVALVPSAVSPFAYRSERATFAITAPERIWGGERVPPNDRRARPRFALAERAILDSLNHPRFGVSLGQAARALRVAMEREPGFAGRLANATARYDSTSAARRAGLLVQRIAGDAAAQPFRELIGAHPAPTLLRPRGPAAGPVDRAWRVRVNVDLDLLAELR